MVADIREPKSVVVPSEAPPSELGFTRQLLKDGGEEKVVPPPGRNDESEKLRKSEEEGAEGVLLALVNRRPGEKERQVENGDNDRQGRRWEGMNKMTREGTKSERTTHREHASQLGNVSILRSLPSSWEQQKKKR